MKIVVLLALVAAFTSTVHGKNVVDFTQDFNFTLEGGVSSFGACNLQITVSRAGKIITLANGLKNTCANTGIPAESVKLDVTALPNGNYPRIDSLTSDKFYVENTEDLDFSVEKDGTITLKAYWFDDVGAWHANPLYTINAQPK